MSILPHTDMADLSRYRSEMMGAAMLMIILFHVSLSPHDTFFGLRRCGNVGVDIFLLLSGVGLWHTWQKNKSVRHFFRRRYLRVYPTWIVVATAFYLPPFLRSGCPASGLADLVGDITLNWDFWLHDELTFWYVPAIMMLYTLAPAYLMLTERHPAWRWLPVLAMCWCVAVQWVSPIHDTVGHIEIFWSRIPVFLIGINIGRAVHDGRPQDGATGALALLTLAATGSLCVYLEQYLHGKFPLFIERMVYIPLTLSLLLLLGRMLAHAPQWVGRALAFIGTLSLEIYLIHVQFILLPVEKWHLGYWPTALITIAASLPAAWVLHKVIGTVIRTLQNSKK